MLIMILIVKNEKILCILLEMKILNFFAISRNFTQFHAIAQFYSKLPRIYITI